MDTPAQGPAGVDMKLVLWGLLGLCGIVAVAKWTAGSSAPPTISEEKAQDIAKSAFRENCEDSENCAEFEAPAAETPADPRYKWAFSYVARSIETPTKMTVLVTPQGEYAVEATTLAPLPEGASGELMPASAPASGETPQ